MTLFLTTLTVATLFGPGFALCLCGMAGGLSLSVHAIRGEF